MKEIKIRGTQDDEWIPVSVLDMMARPGFVQIEQNGEEAWAQWEDVHPADQVALRVEIIAQQRYQWVPPEDMEDG